VATEPSPLKDVSPERLRIGVVCGDALRVEGLRAVLGDACDLLPMTAPDTLREDDLAMVLIDTHEEDLFAMMAAFRRARPGLRLIVLGNRIDPAFIQRVVASGAKGYLLHTASAREIVMSVDVVSDGSIWAPRKVLASLIDTYAPTEARPPQIRLTPREREVIDLLIAGRSNREIASTLGVETKTVKSHVGRLLQKFGVPNRVALTVRALEMQINARRA
jgi:DNA-binding NarL/FixJ family response regulator